MVQPGEDAGLGQELLAQLGKGLRGGVGVGHVFLDRTAASGQPRILGQVDRAHAALAEQAEDAVTGLKELSDG